MLYQRRLFPYYAFNIIAGIDEDGAGAVYGYDALGSAQRLGAAAAGQGAHLLQPGLDLLCRGGAGGMLAEGLSAEDVTAAVRRLFLAAAEREITLGDGVEIVVLKKSKNSGEVVCLREYQELASH
mmetsp:Transcript_35762/g.62445  ORF Transcript_35762/g.62445 Transcript_35762/m.62445 type:complete len:125 (-) Transcript_35762:187-561(-)